MQSVQKIINVTNLSKKNAGTSHEQRKSISLEAASIVNQLFVELQAIFPAWKYAFPDEVSLQQSKKNWAKGFMENQIYSMEQVQRGLKQARQSTSPHMPSVGKFIAWCRCFDEHEFPAVQKAYREACRHAHGLRYAVWSHPAIYVAGQATGFFELKTRSEKETYPIFQRHYAQACERFHQGEDLEALLPKALPVTPQSVAVTPEGAQRKIHRLRETLGLKKRQKVK